MKKFVSLTSHQGLLYALTEYGEVYQLSFINGRMQANLAIVLARN